MKTILVPTHYDWTFSNFIFHFLSSIIFGKRTEILPIFSLLINHMTRKNRFLSSLSDEMRIFHYDFISMCIALVCQHMYFIKDRRCCFENDFYDIRYKEWSKLQNNMEYWSRYTYLPCLEKLFSLHKLIYESRFSFEDSRGKSLLCSVVMLLWGSLQKQQ